MGGLEKTDDGSATLGPPGRNFPSDSRTVVYRAGKKVTAWAIFLGVFFVLLPVMEGFAALGVLFVAVLAAALWFQVDSSATRDITLAPDRIVKRSLLGDTVLPARGALLCVTEQYLRFSFGSAKNRRESVTIQRFFISEWEGGELLEYAAKVYGLTPDSGSASREAAAPSRLAVTEFERCVDSYRMMTGFFALSLLIGFFTVGLSDGAFAGLAPSLPSFPFRLCCMALTLGAFFLLRRLRSKQGGGAELSHLLSLSMRFKRAENSAFSCAVVAALTALLGTVLFLLFGNLLDLYVFLLVGILYYRDCFPRLSVWDRLARGAAEPAGDEEAAAAKLPRRSLQVSLVLMGALALLSYGDERRYVYNSRQDCLDDWGDGKNCQEDPAGRVGSGGLRYFGPRYGSGAGHPTRSVGIGTVSRGGFGSMGSFHASFGG